MVSGEEFRRIALSLPGATEAPHFDRAAFKVARTFATLAADQRSANLKFTPEEQEFKALMAPEIFAPINNGWGRQGWTMIDLAKIGTRELRQALEMAYAHALPKQSRARRKGPSSPR